MEATEVLRCRLTDEEPVVGPALLGPGRESGNLVLTSSAPLVLAPLGRVEVEASFGRAAFFLPFPV